MRSWLGLGAALAAALTVAVTGALGASSGGTRSGVSAVTPTPAAWAGRVTFPVYLPAVTLGFARKLDGPFPCGYGGIESMNARYTRGRAVIALHQGICGDPGESMTVTSADINGVRVSINVFCYSPGPKCTVADGFRTGFLLTVTPPGPKRTPIQITSARVSLAATGASGSSSGANVTSTLRRSALLALTGSGGTITAVVYDGNHALAFRDTAATTAMTGFTAPAAPLIAKTTFVIADGQCGSKAPNGCNGVLSDVRGDVGRGDSLSFSGGSGTASDGPDAVKGSSGCPWGHDTCLWDTKTFDVSQFVAPGDTTVSVTAARGVEPAGYDCFNHEAQVFAVGPTAAWADAGYVAAGTGLRNQASGTVSLSGIPASSAVIKTFLYWNVLDTPEPPAGITFGAAVIRGAMIGRDESPCWPTQWSYAYRADVTSRVAGNGTYSIAGHPTGNTSGRDPWTGDLPAAPLMEGASLIVFYGRKAPPSTVTGTPTGAVLVDEKPYTGGPIPYGSKVDVTKGKVTLKIDVGTLTASGGAGITAQFVLLRARVAGKPVVELRLAGGDFTACRVRAVQAKRKPPKAVRRVWAKGKGAFRTRGRYATATVRATDWLTADRCDGTLVRTRQGVLSVRDFVRKKTLLVRAGKSYLAKKP